MTSRTRALLYAVFALVVGGAAYFLGVGSFLGQKAEASVLDASAFDADPEGPLRLVTPTNLIIALIVIGLLALWVHGLARATSILVASSFAIIASQILKERWLERPELLELDAANTFPSGHMTVYTVLVGALIWALPRGARSVIMLAVTVLLGIVSWQLLEYGWHRPSDLIGAQALALFAFGAAAWLGPRKTRRQTRPSGAVFVAANGLISIILTIVGIALILGSVVLIAIASATHSDVLLLNSGEIALMGVGALTVRTLTRLSP